MTKALAWLLLLANLVALGWWQGWLQSWLPSGREPERLATQVEPQRLQPVPVAELQAARASVAERCIEVGLLDEDTRQRVAAWAQGLAGVRGRALASGYRLIFPQGTPQAQIDASAAELAVIATRAPIRCTDP
ncbi:MAG: hypothetical protein VW339_05020 [Quisquiliibacterium sp.]